LGGFPHPWAGHRADPQCGCFEGGLKPCVVEKLRGRQCPFRDGVNMLRFSAHHAAIVARPFVPDQDAVAVEEIRGSPELGEMQRICNLDHFIASMRGPELVQ